MHTYFFTELSVFRYRHRARQKFVRQFFWLVLTALLTGHMLPAFNANVCSATQRNITPNQRTIKKDKRQSSSPRYECGGKLLRDAKTEAHYVEQAINDAIDILKKCESCWKLFDSEDSTYAIKLLMRLRQDEVIVISEKTPSQWKLSPDRSLKVYTTTDLPGGAGVLDLAAPRPGEMKRPCIYIHPKKFMVTGQLAEGYALYGLEPSVQRAVAILHELAHVAGIIQSDSGLTKEGRAKSVENTNCIRVNCISCSVLRPCPGVPLRIKRARNTPTLKPSNMFEGHSGG